MRFGRALRAIPYGAFETLGSDLLERRQYHNVKKLLCTRRGTRRQSSGAPARRATSRRSRSVSRPCRRRSERPCPRHRRKPLAPPRPIRETIPAPRPLETWRSARANRHVDQKFTSGSERCSRPCPCIRSCRCSYRGVASPLGFFTRLPCSTPWRRGGGLSPPEEGASAAGPSVGGCMEEGVPRGGASGGSGASGASPQAARAAAAPCSSFLAYSISWDASLARPVCPATANSREFESFGARIGERHRTDG